MSGAADKKREKEREKEKDLAFALDPENIKEVLSRKDPVAREKGIGLMRDTAKKHGAAGRFDGMFKATKQEVAMDAGAMENQTQFTDCPYGPLRCGAWIATDEGVRAMNYESGRQDVWACKHPIIPVKRLQNLQTGEEQLMVAFRRDGKWHDLTVPKTTVTQASKVVGLAAHGVLVTSESAKMLVRYLSDVEIANEGEIRLTKSSSKMGWVGETFLPYDGEIEFDGSARFREIYGGIGEHGVPEEWFGHVKKLRASGRPEILLAIAASLSSVLMPIVDALPFVVDFWGETGSGKTVALMLAASVWADPRKGKFVGDYASTDVGLETRADFLNHLPMVLDDTSKRNRGIEQRFEEIIYNLCSGKGKTRSNKELGINRETTWCNAILTNGERPLTGYVTQGGAINRVIEVECGMGMFEDPQGTVDVIKSSYGWAGKVFVDAIRDMGADEVRKIQRGFQERIMAMGEKAEKQAISLSVMLAADKIATERLFKDGRYIDMAAAVDMLTAQSEVSDNERCYQFILDKVAMNPSRFDESAKTEQWGSIRDGKAYIYAAAMQQLCEEGGFSQRAFTKWAGNNGLLEKDGYGKNSKNVRGKGRTYILRLEDHESPESGDGGGFEDVGQSELPFV